MTLDEIRAELETAIDLPEAALRCAVAEADALAPSVLALVDKAARGIHLMPRQAALLFYGIYALAAARHQGLFRPLLELLRRPERELEALLGDCGNDHLSRIVLSVFDGDASALIAAIEDRAIDGYVRWSLFGALTRLTFDGSVPHAPTLDLIDRFDRDRLAPDGDGAWRGWQDAILLLALADHADRVRAAWSDGRIDEREIDRLDWEERMQAASADPGNPARFGEIDLAPLGDPVEAISSFGRPLALEADELEEVEDVEDLEDMEDLEDWDGADDQAEDPAADIALSETEVDWLEGFLSSDQVPAASMTLEMLDGYVTALLAGPRRLPDEIVFPEIWGSPGGRPTFDSDEQRDYVGDLMNRHWASIARRLAEGYPIRPLVDWRRPERIADEWANGFLAGMGMAADAWEPLVQDADAGELLGPIFLLQTAMPELYSEPPTQDDRAICAACLGLTVKGIQAFWAAGGALRRPASEPIRRGPKVGRNDPCPCGSGRKYKRCCGAN